MGAGVLGIHCMPVDGKCKLRGVVTSRISVIECCVEMYLNTERTWTLAITFLLALLTQHTS